MVQLRSAVNRWIKKTRLPKVSPWINDDIRPIDSRRRTWGYLTFHNCWLITNCNITTYLTGSALIPLGLTWWQAFISIILGSIIAAVVTVLNSLPGGYYSLGFSVFNRAVWGMWGSQFAIWNRVFLSLIWYAFTAWIGGQCVYVVLLSLDLELDRHIPNTFSSDAAMTTVGFVCYIIFCIISLPAIWIRPHKVQTLFYITSSITGVFFITLLIWSLATMGPMGFGSTLKNTTSLPNTGSRTSVAWLMIYGIMSTIGSIAAGILNQNDYARFATRPMHAIAGQAFAFPVYSIFTSLIGILVTAATQNRFNGPVWNLPEVFVRLLQQDGSAGTRAACFFSGLAMIASQLALNTIGNALSGGFDLAATIPQYINVRRGSYIIAILSIVINPWRLVNTATVFLTVLSAYGVFLAPMTGMMVASYLVVNKQKINVDDLYRGNINSIYWYTGGCNWRAAVAWVIGVAPCLPGFLNAVNPSIYVSQGAIELFYLSYLYGLLAAGVSYVALHRFFPAQKVDEFVAQSSVAEDIQVFYRQRWDGDVTLFHDELAEDNASARGKACELKVTLAEQ